MDEKNLSLERLVFFSDAVVAIAITLLALDISVPSTATGHLHFSDLANLWKPLTAFALSFFNIANFWRTHHAFFAYINRIDERLLWYNLLWLLFIVLFPFSTSLLSSFLDDRVAVFVYSLNTLLIALFQNLIWDYASDKHYLIQEKISPRIDARIRSFCNLDMINGVLALVVSFFSPVAAFVLLLTKLPLIIIARFFYRTGGTNRSQPTQ